MDVNTIVTIIKNTIRTIQIESTHILLIYLGPGEESEKEGTDLHFKQFLPLAPE